MKEEGDKILKIAVFGAGTMGLGIIQVFAESGNTVLVYDIDMDFAKKQVEKLAASLSKRVAAGKMTQEDLDALLGNVRVEDKAACADVDLVVECVKEEMSVKKAVWKELDDICGPGTVFATNTSSLSISEMGNGLKHPLIGLHFFNPAPVMKLVEIIRGVNTTQETYDFVYQVALQIGKTPVEVSEAPGFVVNRILFPMINEAIGLVETGVASVEDIDKAMQLGANHRMGPLALADLVGLDICLAIMETLYHETCDSKYRPALLLKKMVRGNLLGKKTGKGFYQYD